MKKYKYNITGLDCANCARKIEDGLNKNKKLNDVVVNFNTSKISYESNSVELKQLQNLVKKIDSEAIISSEIIENNNEYHIFPLIISLIISLLLMVFKLPSLLNILLYIIAYGLLLYKPVINAIKLLINSKTINENLLITISSLGAFFINQKMEGLMVVFLYDLGKILEEKAINNSKKSINDIINIKQDYANLICKNETKKIDVEEIKIGDLLLVKKGEKIPVDGVIEKGTAVLDTSSLTGESEFVNSKKGDQVLSSTINVGELIIIRATKIYNDSTVAKILDLVMNATDKKAKTETMVSKISKYYTPLIVLLALIVLIILPFFGVSIEDSLYRSLTFLVISCPCAIAISVPLSYFTGIGVSSKRGILIKGSNYLDNLSKIEAIVFDKTGTITNGSFTIKSIDILDKKYSKEKVLEILAKGESFSNHPIAKAILKLCLHAKTKDVKNYKEITGEGISFEINKDKIIIGTQKICNCNIINTNLHLNINGKHIASIIVDDGIKKEASKVINYLNNNGIMTYMFTGDKKDLALDVGKKINIGEINYEMLPTDKYQKLELLKKKYQMLAFVGDGINDAPVLKLADIGISMGNLGQSSAIEASDIVIMNDNLEKIIESINISKYTNKIIRENLIFALGVKILILILSIFGLVNMWFAVFADTGVTILTILNTLRILTFINDKKNK